MVQHQIGEWIALIGAFPFGIAFAVIAGGLFDSAIKERNFMNFIGGLGLCIILWMIAAGAYRFSESAGIVYAAIFGLGVLLLPVWFSIKT